MVKMYNIGYNSNPEAQISAMRSLWPQFTHKCVGNKIIFTGCLKVSEEIQEYKIKVVYDGGSAPRVYILRPQLVDNPKHVYKEGCLCLYHPDNFKWNAHKLVAQEIMQWTCAWIYCYEYWLQSGEWVGPEVAHNNQKKSQ